MSDAAMEVLRFAKLFDHSIVRPDATHGGGTCWPICRPVRVASGSTRMEQFVRGFEELSPEERAPVERWPCFCDRLGR
jgi:hypothetical protein